MRFDGAAKFAIVTAILVLGISAVAFRAAARSLNIYLQKEPVALRGPLGRVPTTLGRWSQGGQDTLLSEAMVEELGTGSYLNRFYVLNGDEAQGVLQLHLAYYTGGIDSVPHVPERCWDAAGKGMVAPPQVVSLELDDEAWRPSDVPPNAATGDPYRAVEVTDPISGRTSTVHLPIGDFEIQVTEFQDSSDGSSRLIGGYFFIANGRLTPSAYAVRGLAFQKTERSAYYCKVQFNMHAEAENEERMDEFLAHVSELLSDLLPHLMSRLPDWPEQEATGDAPAPNET